VPKVYFGKSVKVLLVAILDHYVYKPKASNQPHLLRFRKNNC